MPALFDLNPLAEIYVPEGIDPLEALRRTTHLAVGAHPDDVEIMAQHGIIACYQKSSRHFTAVILTNGSGSPRTGSYAAATNDGLVLLRREEQLRAAEIGAYSAVVLLNYDSAAVKHDTGTAILDDLIKLFTLATPEILYTHQPADRHPTHVAVCARVLEALRQQPAVARPKIIYGCEVWRSLDWVDEPERISLDVSGHEELRRALLQVYSSQIAGGKRYDLAVIGRQQANATFNSSHTTDAAEAVNYALNLLPLITEGDLETYIRQLIDQFNEHTTEILRGVCT